MVKFTLKLQSNLGKIASMIAKILSETIFVRLFEFFLISFFACFGLSASAEGDPIQFSVHASHLHSSGEVDSLEFFVNRDILVLERYGNTKRRLVKKGTMVKVYLIQGATDPAKANDEFHSANIAYRGAFESIIGDELTIVNNGKVMKFDIDDLYQIKVYNDIGARVFGDVMNLTGFSGIGIAGLVLVAGAGLAFEQNPWATSVIAIGVGFGALGYAIHRLALLIRRTKYDLIGDWFIVRNI